MIRQSRRLKILHRRRQTVVENVTPRLHGRSRWVGNHTSTSIIIRFIDGVIGFVLT
jgi:hypothetical protein